MSFHVRGAWRFVLVGFIAGAAITRTGRRASPTITQQPTSQEALIQQAVLRTVTAEVEQAEHIFGYGVVVDVWRRSVDSIRFLDALVFAIFAAQVALFVLYIDKTDRFDALVPQIKLAFVFSVAAFLPTLLTKELPSPRKFDNEFRKAPQQTRDDLIYQFIGAARWNAVVRTIKLALFAAAFVTTLYAVFKAGGIQVSAAGTDPTATRGGYRAL